MTPETLRQAGRYAMNYDGAGGEGIINHADAWQANVTDTARLREALQTLLLEAQTRDLMPTADTVGQILARAALESAHD